MSAITDLNILISQMEPKLVEGEFVFCTLPTSHYGDLSDANPIASFQESEGLTLVLKQTDAEAHQLEFEGSYSCITLMVHSSLEAVGLTAAFSTALSNAGISANVIAGYHHDHIFVPQAKAKTALKVLKQLSIERRNQIRR